MRIIPVLDLKGGVVVRAKSGRRDLYGPLVSPLTDGADPVAVVRGLRRLAPFATFYVADLDAIEGRAPNARALLGLAEMADPPDIWLDAGFADQASLTAALESPAVSPVLGSESQRDAALLTRHRGNERLILSLDFFADGYRGPADILEKPAIWPNRVIVMTLARVGSAGGPDLARLDEVKARAGGRDIVAAGGVRNRDDLAALGARGIDAALVATALHDGTITRDDVAVTEFEAATKFTPRA